MRWKRKQYVGFAVRSMAELMRVVSLGANMVEVRLDHFARSGTPIYSFENGAFAINEDFVSELALFTSAQNVSVQLHLPIESCIDNDCEEGLNAGMSAHHSAIIDRFMMLEDLYERYGIGQIITLHPSVISLNGKEIIEERMAIENAKIVFDALDRIRVTHNCKTKIGVENQTDIKKKSGSLGYKPIHFRRIFKDTRTIGVTIDSGHRRLAKKFSIREFLQLGLPVNNFHFHGNAGVFN